MKIYYLARDERETTKIDNYLVFSTEDWKPIIGSNVPDSELQKYEIEEDLKLTVVFVFSGAYEKLVASLEKDGLIETLEILTYELVTLGAANQGLRMINKKSFLTPFGY